VTAVALDLTDLVGPFDPDNPDPEALVGWCRSASEHGLWHDWLLASEPDVVRAVRGGAPTELDQQELHDPSSSHHTALIESSPTPAALTVTIDATWLGPHETGAQVLTTAAIEALSRQPGIAAMTLTGIDRLPRYAEHLADLPNVRVASEDPVRADVVWYPNQIDHRSNIGAARALGSRVITTYLDLIAYDIPRYHASDQAWGAYRALQRTIALSVDGITTISADVAQRLLQEVPRLDPQRVRPIPLGLDHITRQVPAAEDDIRGLAEAVSGRPYLLVLGNDFVHKNRDFAIRVWERILEHGVSCDLVLAGLHVRSSSSKVQEDALLAVHTNLRGRVHTVGHVSSASRTWLLANAAAVIYPSSAEGFGFIPYEAAMCGTPTTFTAFGPLAEISGVTSVPRRWDVAEYAADVIALLTDEQAAGRRIQDLRGVQDRLTWDSFAKELVDFFVHIRSMPTATALVPNTALAAAAITPPRSRRAARALRGAVRRIGRSRR
jgi:glycosyltransferase involved in cell wall biosynthesis